MRWRLKKTAFLMIRSILKSQSKKLLQALSRVVSDMAARMEFYLAAVSAIETYLAPVFTARSRLKRATIS